MTDREPLPYYENAYRDKLNLFSDAAGLILDTYGASAVGIGEQPIDVASWTDSEIATSYELARFQPEATIDPRLKHQIDLKVTVSYPNGEESIKTHRINPSTFTKSTRMQQMTEAERAEQEERVRASKELMPELPTGQVRVLSPRKDDLEPEHEVELLLGVLNRGLEILEQTSRNDQNP